MNTIALTRYIYNVIEPIDLKHIATYLQSFQLEYILLAGNPMATASLFRVCFGADITTERVAPTKFSLFARRQVWSSKVHCHAHGDTAYRYRNGSK